MFRDSYFNNVDPKQLGQTLQAARTRAKLTQKAVGDDLGVNRQTIIDFEQGKRLPSPNYLIRMAELFNQSVHDLLRQGPITEPISLQLRASRRIDEALEQELERKRAEFQELCEDYVTLEHLLHSPLPAAQAPIYQSSGDKLERLAEDAAIAERHRLGLGDAPILNLREVLENEGIRIFQIGLPSRIAGFYGATSELGPCMAINIKHPAERRRYTLGHEFGHFLTERYRAEISVFYTYREVPESERYADAFARSFLMPSSSVSRRFHEMKRSRGSLVPTDLCLLADFFFVSIEAMALRLEDLHLIRSGMYDTLIANGFRPSEARAQLKLQPHEISNHTFPLRYQYLATEALFNGDITEEDYAHFLRTDIVAARNIAEQLRKRPSQSPSGEPGEVILSLDNLKDA